MTDMNWKKVADSLEAVAADRLDRAKLIDDNMHVHEIAGHAEQSLRNRDAYRVEAGIAELIAKCLRAGMKSP